MRDSSQVCPPYKLYRRLVSLQTFTGLLQADRKVIPTKSSPGAMFRRFCEFSKFVASFAHAQQEHFHAVPYKMAASDSGDSGFMTFASSPVVFNQESSSTMSMIDSPVSFDSSTSFLQLSIDSHESSTRLGVLGLGKTKKIKPARTGPAETSLCEFCKVYLNSQIQAAAHNQGKGHLRKVKAAAKIAELEVLSKSSLLLYTLSIPADF